MTASLRLVRGSVEPDARAAVPGRRRAIWPHDGVGSGPGGSVLSVATGSWVEPLAILPAVAEAAREMDRRGLERRVEAQVAHIEELFLSATHALAQALEAKDAYTWGHSARVGVLAAAMARELGVELDDIAEIGLGGELHDVGKIGVPESLLHKPGPLTPKEYRRVMEHTVIGERILSPLLRHHPTVLSIVRSHHERVDGRGLPDGLQGDEIPLDARIVAAADAFDAMTSPRPYRAAPLDPGAAMDELARNVGSQFDSECVQALQAALPDRRMARASTRAWSNPSCPLRFSRVDSAGAPSLTLQM